MPVLESLSRLGGLHRGCTARRASTLLVVAFLSAAWLSFPGAALANGTSRTRTTDGELPALTVSVVPGSLSMLAGDRGRTAIVIDNETAVAFVVTGIEVLAPPRLTTSLNGVHLPATVAAGSSVITHIDVLTRAELKEAQIGVVVRYRAAANGSVKRSGTTNLTVSAAPIMAPTVTFLTAPDALNDGEVRVTTVRIDNPSSREYTHLSLAAINGDDVSITTKGRPAKPFVDCADGAGMICIPSLQPGTSATLDLQTRAATSVRPGTQTFGLVLTSTPGADLPSVTATATHDVKLAVFGVDALSPFGVGTLFVLPGLLAVVFFLLGNALYPRTKSLPDQADLKDLRQMPAVVAVSAAAYLLIFVLFGSDLTRAVSTKGVALLLAFGATIGIVAWGVLAGFYRSIVGRKIFQLDDSPREVLSRLIARNTTLELPSFTSGGVEYARLGLAPGGEIYAAPRIAFRFTEAAEAQTQDDARARLLNQIGRGEIEPVLAAERGHFLELHWVEPSGVRTFDEAASLPTGKANILKQAT